MYEFMQRTVVQCAFMLIIAADVWWISYMAISFVKWLRKNLHKTDVEETAAAKT